MKRFISALAALSILLTFASCVKKEMQTDEVKATTQIVQTTQAEETTLAAAELKEESTESEKPAVTEAAQSYKNAYLEIIKSKEKEYGKYTDGKEKDTYSGVLFCELFDWNLDGVPELMIGYSEDENITWNIEHLDIYTFENGEAKNLLSREMYAACGALDPSQEICFTYGKDGTLYIALSNEESEEMSVIGETFYSYTDGEVESVRFYAGEGGYDSPYTLFKIDGKEVSEKEYNEKLEQLGDEEKMYFHITRYDYNALTDYLSGETNSYTTEFFELYTYPDEISAWVSEVNFGYNKTFTK